MLSEQQQRIMGYFIEEAKDHLNTIEQGLINLQSTINDSEMVNEVFRAAHSVKGGAAMLGLSSIQRTAHRLEDCFKVLKECPQVPIDQKLETLFLRVYDTLHDLVDQLQGPFGLTEDKAQEAMANVEPVFAELGQHLDALVSQVGGVLPEDVNLNAIPLSSPPVSTPPISAPPQVAQPAISEESAFQFIFQNDVPARLREMLQLFKQGEHPDTRQQLQAICRSLSQPGEQFDLPTWCELLSTAQRAIGNEENTYRTLAPIIIKDIKRAQEFILSGRAASVSASEDLLNLLPPEPPVVDTTPDEDLDFADLLALGVENDTPLTETGIGEGEADPFAALFSDDEADVSPIAADDWLNDLNPPNEAPVSFDVEATDSIQDDASVLDFGLGFDEALSVANDTTTETPDFSLPDFSLIDQLGEGSPPPEAGTEQSGPEVGVAELNSLADLFEGELSDLGLTWQQEEALNPNAPQESFEPADPQGDFFDLTPDRSSWDFSLENEGEDDLSGLLNAAASQAAASLGNEATQDVTLPNLADASLADASSPTGIDALFLPEPIAELDTSSDDIAIFFTEPSEAAIESPDASGSPESADSSELENLDELFLGIEGEEFTAEAIESPDTLEMEAAEFQAIFATTEDGTELAIEDPATTAEGDEFDALFDAVDAEAGEGFDIAEPTPPEEPLFAAEDLSESASADSLMDDLFADMTADIDADMPGDINASGMAESDAAVDVAADAAAASEATANSDTPDGDALDLGVLDLDELNLDGLNLDAVGGDALTLEGEILEEENPSEAAQAEDSSDLWAAESIYNAEENPLEENPFQESAIDSEPLMPSENIPSELWTSDADLTEIASDVQGEVGSSDEQSIFELDNVAIDGELGDTGLDAAIDWDGLPVAATEEAANLADLNANADSNADLDLPEFNLDLEDTEFSFEEEIFGFEAENLNIEAGSDAENSDIAPSGNAETEPTEDAFNPFAIDEVDFIGSPDLEGIGFDAEFNAELGAEFDAELSDTELQGVEPQDTEQATELQEAAFDLSEIEALHLQEELAAELQANLVEAPNSELSTELLEDSEPEFDLAEIEALHLQEELQAELQANLVEPPSPEPNTELDAEPEFDLTSLDVDQPTDLTESDAVDELSDLDTFFANESSIAAEWNDAPADTEIPSDSDLNNFADNNFADNNFADNDFADLEAMLGDELPAVEAASVPEASATETNLSATVESDDFADLEALIDNEPPASAPPIPAATTSPPAVSDDEFGDLEALLQDADQKLGVGSSPVRSSTSAAARRPSRRNVIADQTMRVSVKHLDNLNNLVGEMVVNRNSLEQAQERLRQFLDNLLYQVQQLSDVGQRMRDLYERSLLESSLLSSRRSYQLSGGSTTQSNHATGASFDALEMDRFTGFHTLSQEMIELIVRVRESASDIDFVVEESDQTTRNFRQITTQLQEGLTRSRMVPFAQTADRLPRGVRDNAIKYGKQAELIIEGRDTLIDKMIVEQLYDPMTHLVNNAIAHGIETPEERTAAGKSPVGRITIRAFHQGNQTVISVSDDGAGINPNTVKAKALAKGLISPVDAEQLSHLDIYDLLFHHGFSTADQVDDLRGRGVGLDVVRNNLSEIRGVITIDSSVGKGTTFTIRLPLTLSISKALCCISNRARIAFPMDGVEDMLDIPKERIQTDEQGRSCIQWRDTLLPFQPLAELLKYNRVLGRGSVYGGNQEDDVLSVVVLRSAGNYLALQVDQVLGEQEIVIKQLEGPVPKPIGVAGATVLGDGRIMPIADVLELIDLSQGRIRREANNALWETSGEPVAQDPSTLKLEPTVLIVDDSITVRELLSMTFNKVGYRVEQARDGQEAWEKLRSGLPCDLVFCDIEMPRMDGLELLSRLQKDPQLNEIPIAMLTSRGADRHRQMAVQLGAKGYFTKPYLEEVLLDAAQRMLKGEVLVTANS